MTQPKNAYQNPGKGRYYRHPLTGEEFVSVTNVNQTSVAKQLLAPAAARETAKKAWDMLPQLVWGSRKGPETKWQLTDELKGHYQMLWAQAADVGTRVHARVEAHVLDKPQPPDPEAEPFALQAIKWMLDFGIVPTEDIECAEATILNRAVGYAGTGDLWVWVRNEVGKRELWLVDYKTSKTQPVDRVYPEYGLQTCALAAGEVLLLPDGEEVPPPGPIDRLGILNLRADNYALIEMPLEGTREECFAAFASSVPHAKYLHSCYGAKPHIIPAPTLQAVS